MAVTVGRIEYIVGADGRVLEKEARDAARKAGKNSGKTYSDEFVASFRERFGGPSGFAKTLGKYDQNVINQFRRLGGFTSKAYATRFEKTLRPAYQASAKRMVDYFNKLTFSGTTVDLTDIFKGGPELEGQLRKVQALMDELETSRRLQLIDKDILAGLDIGALNRFRAAIEETLDLEDWDLVGKKQLELNAAMEEGVAAMERQAELIDRRRQAMERGQTGESDAWREINEFIVQVNKALDEGVGVSRGRVTDAKALAQAARDGVAAEEERIRLQIRANRIRIDEHNQTKKMLDLDEELARVRRVTLEQERQLNREAAKAIELDKSRVAISGEMSDSLREEMELARQYLSGQLDLSEELAEIERERLELEEDHIEVLGAEARAQQIVNALTDEQKDAIRAAVGAQRDHVEVLEERAEVEERVAESTEKNIDGQNRLRTALRGTTRRMLEYRDAVRDAEHHTGLLHRLADSLGDRISKIGTRSDLNPRAIATIIATLGEPIAALGAAIGPALFVLGGLGAAAAVGIGGLIPVFSVLNEEIDDLPDDLKDVAREWQALGDVMSEQKFDIARAAFAEMGETFPTLEKTVRALNPLFRRLGTVTGKLFDDFATNTAEGTEGFEAIQTLIDDSIPLFDELARISGDFLLAFIQGVNEANPLTEKFVGWLGEMADDFSDFVNGPGFDEWLGHAEQVFGSLDGLLESTGEMLDNLVTDESIGRLTDFIDGLAEFMPHLEDLIAIFGELDPLNLIVDTLNAFSEALEPLVEPLKDFAEGLHAVVDAGVEKIAGPLEDISEALAPLVQNVADFLNENPEEIANWVVNLGAALVLFKIGKWTSLVAGVATFANIKGLGKNVGLMAGLALAVDQLGAALDENKDMNAGLSGLSGALIGARFGGPIGALVGTLAGLIASMIEDVFLTPDVKGSWQEGWDQIFDPNNYTGAGIGDLKLWFQQNLMGPDPNIPESGGGWLDQVVTNWGTTLEGFKAGIPTFFEGVGEWFATGWSTVTTWFDTNFVQPIKTGWAGFVNFWTVEVPNFFAGIGTWWQEGWAGVSRWFDQTFVQPVKTGWEGFVAFWTVEVPGFFAMIGEWFATGWATVSAWFDTTFVQPVRNAWNGFVTFWTVQVPAWFARMVGEFQRGLARLVAPFASFFADVQTNWNNFWTGLGAIVSTVWTGITSAIRGAVNTAIGIINGFIATVNGALTTIRNLTGGLVNIRIPSIPRAAEGMLLNNGARLVVAGEAGPEALVPLARPLSRVDPSVRALSAFAQGLPVPGSGHHVPRGSAGGRQVTFAEGSIVVRGSLDPRRTAIDVANQIAEKVGG